MSKLIMFPGAGETPAADNSVSACDMLAHLSTTVPDDGLLFHSANMDLGDVNLALDQIKKALLEGGLM